MSTACPSCASAVAETDRFCERCGTLLRPGPQRWIAWRSSAAPAAPCAGCGGTVGAEGYCDTCGRPLAAGHDRVELDLPGVAAVTDRGLARRRNEDAVAIGRAGPAPAPIGGSAGFGAAGGSAGSGDEGAAGFVSVAVVCDGVSSSVRSDTASLAAVEAGIVALLRALADGAAAGTATEAGALAAAAAVSALPGARASRNPPSTTYVSAVVTERDVTVGWVGDSRAYWLPDDPAQARMLTIDDSLAARRAAAGVPAPDGAHADPRSVALLRWVGADAPDQAPQVVRFVPAGPGRVLLCSDGLSRYFGTATHLAAAVPVEPSHVAPVDGSGGDGDGDGEPTGATVARVLTRAALDAGGRDNITVVVLPFPPPEEPEQPAEQPAAAAVPAVGGAPAAAVPAADAGVATGTTVGESEGVWR
jgi:PPM family protein phosphatase